MKGSNSSDCPIEVVVPESSGSSLVDRRQLDKVDGGAWCDCVVRVRFDLFSDSKVFLELDRKVLRSMRSASIAFISESRGASKAAQLVSAKKQIDFVRKEGGSIFEEPVVRLANLLKITDNSHNRNCNGSFSSHLFVGPEASILEDQVDPIRNVYQVVDTRDLSMHAVESSNLTRQGMFGEVLSESIIELFIIMSPFHEGCSKVLTSHFDFRVPLVSWLTTKVSMFIERRVRGTSSHFVREWCGSTPTVDADGLAQLDNGGICVRHDFIVFLAQERVRLSNTSHGTRRNSEHRWFELSVLRLHRIIFMCPKSIGWLQSERSQVSKFVDGLDFMIVLRHVVGLPFRLWHRHRIVAGWCCRPRGFVRIFCFVVGLEWPGFSVVVVVIVVVIGVGVVVVGVRLVRSSRSLCFRGIRMPGLVDPVVFDFWLSGTRILSG